MALASQPLAIEIKNLEVSFADLTIFKDLNLQLRESECLVIVGPSGSGKSVLLKSIAGLIKPTRGAVFIREKDLNAMFGTSQQELLLQMGMLFQKNALFDSLNCGDNIAFPLRETTEKSEAEIDKVVDFFLDAVGISHAKLLFPDEISGGMQKRLGIARALALDPQIIFFDDPTAGLDPITSRKIINLILDLKKQKNSTFIAVTNDMNRAYQMADKIAMLVDQELIITGTPAETKKHKDPRVIQFIHGSATGPLTVSER